MSADDLKSIWGALPNPEDTDDPLMYITELFPPEHVVDLHFIHATNTWIDRTGTPRKVTRDYFIRTNEIGEETVQHVRKMQREGYHAYVCMNLLTGKPDEYDGKLHRRERDVARVTSVYTDIDANGRDGLQKIVAAVHDGLVPKPHFVVQSSPGKYQVVWLVDDFTIPQQRAVNKAVQLLCGGDSQAVDAVRVLRLPNTYNLKPEYRTDGGFPLAMLTNLEVDGVEHTDSEARRYRPEDFMLPYEVRKFNDATPVDDAEFARRIELVKVNLDAANVDYSIQNRLDEDGYLLFEFECPWKDQHTTAGDTAAIFLRAAGGYGFHCFHAHCGGRHWKPDVRNWVEEHARSRMISWGDVPFDQTLEGKALRNDDDESAPSGPESLKEAPADAGLKVQMMTVAEDTTNGIPVNRGDFDTTETGNALRVIARDGQNFRYVTEEGQFIVFDKKEGIWKYDRDHQKMQRLMAQMVRSLKTEAEAAMVGAEEAIKSFRSQLTSKFEPREKVVLTAEQDAALAQFKSVQKYCMWAKTSEAKRKISDSTNLIYIQPYDVNISLDQLDRDRMICNVMNGALVFSEDGTIIFRNHLRSDLCTQRMPMKFDPSATAPEFLETLSEMCLGDKDMMNMFQEFLGLCLTGVVIREAFILIGGGGDGKGTLGRIMVAVLGKGSDGYALEVGMKTFLESRDEGHGGTARSDLKQMRGKRLMVASETGNKGGNNTLNMPLIKRLTGSDSVNTRGNYDKEQTVFEPVGKILLLSNYEPKVTDNSKAARDRLKIARCLMSLTPEEIDFSLEGRIIQNEGSGILNWLLEGAQRCFQRKAAGGTLVKFTDRVEHDSFKFHDEQNPMNNFVRISLEPIGSVDPDVVYQSYVEFTKTNNNFPEQKSTFLKYVCWKYRIQQPEPGQPLVGIRLRGSEVHYAA